MNEPFSFEQRPQRIIGAKAVALPQAIRKRVWKTVHCDGAKLLCVVELKAPVGDVAEAVRLLQDSLEYRRKLAGRGVDHLQHLGGRSLLLQRLAGLGDEAS